jgi:hypothetical protein
MFDLPIQGLEDELRTISDLFLGFADAAFWNSLGESCIHDDILFLLVNS